MDQEAGLPTRNLLKESQAFITDDGRSAAAAALSADG
jgi:hypothetical protein